MNSIGAAFPEEAVATAVNEITTYHEELISSGTAVVILSATTDGALTVRRDKSRRLYPRIFYDTFPLDMLPLGPPSFSRKPRAA